APLARAKLRVVPHAARAEAEPRAVPAGIEPQLERAVRRGALRAGTDRRADADLRLRGARDEQARDREENRAHARERRPTPTSGQQTGKRSRRRSPNWQRDPACQPDNLAGRRGSAPGTEA